MNRDELHEEYKAVVKKMLRRFSSDILFEMSIGSDITVDGIIDRFIEEDIRNVPNPKWQPDE